MEGRAEEYLQQQVTEGRCVVCNHSTFEEDMQQARGPNGECVRSVLVPFARFLHS